MRIVLWSPNYAPELTGIPPLVTDAAEWLAARGHEVEVVTAVPNYPERVIHEEYRGALWRSETQGAVRVHRSWLHVKPAETFTDKALYEASFTAFSLPRIARRIRSADVVVCVVPTLTSAAASAVLRGLARGSPRLVVWVQDLVLQAAASVVRKGRATRVALKAATALEQVAFSSADKIITCSAEFRGHLVARGADPRSLVVLPNWVDTDAIRPRGSNGRNGRTRFLYTGNIGYTQGLETLLEAAHLAEGVAEVRIAGDGNQATRIRKLSAIIGNVEVSGLVPNEEFPDLLASANVDVVLQRRIGAGANLPSKIGTYLASGKPILAAVGPGTEAARVLERSGGAILVPPESPEDLAAAMERLHGDPQLQDALGRSGREFAERSLSRTRLLPEFEAAVLGTDGRPALNVDPDAR
jgi:colanic acid biosynthesis glycosyl transferase WcaI